MVSAGAKLAPWWAVAVNGYVWLQARRYVTTFEGFRRPWSHLAELLPALRAQPILLGGAYVARGTKTGTSGGST